MVGVFRVHYWFQKTKYRITVGVRVASVWNGDVLADLLETQREGQGIAANGLPVPFSSPR